MSCGSGAGTGAMSGAMSNLMGGGGFAGWDASQSSFTQFGGKVTISFSDAPVGIERDMAIESK